MPRERQSSIATWAEAVELLPCKHGCADWSPNADEHVATCPAYYRPLISSRLYRLLFALTVVEPLLGTEHPATRGMVRDILGKSDG